MERRQFIYTFILGSGGILASGNLMGVNVMNENNMIIRMIYNNTGESGDLKNAWGLSVWIEDQTGATLFDTGGKSSFLTKNMQSLALDPKNLQRIIISHDHWDHTGGLESVINQSDRRADLYVVQEIRESYAAKFTGVNVVGVSNPQRIEENIWSTGSLKATHRSGDIYEQSLLLTKSESMVLITGCSHPGIVKIVKRAQNMHPGKKLVFVAGGFHLMREAEESVQKISQDLLDLGVEKIAPSHCTGDRSIEIFKETWGDRFVSFDLGEQKMI